MASFNNKGIDGIKEYIANKIQYPSHSLMKGESGTVVTQFVIMEDGSIIDLQIINEAEISLQLEVISALLSTDKKWDPGMCHGKNVRTIYTLPVNFLLYEIMPLPN